MPEDVYCTNVSKIEEPSLNLHEVNLNPNGHKCRVQDPDSQLVAQCRKTVPTAAPKTPWPNLELAPVLNVENLSEERKSQQKKYYNRVQEEGGCLKPKGVWGNPFDSRCTILTMAKIGPYLPGQAVLDWGSGCGHQATYMTKTFGVRVVGLDINAVAVDWAKKHSIGRFVGPTDGTDLSWIPDASFDHFYSFATVYYVRPEDMCKFGKEVVRILKPGGTALFGWLDGTWSRPYGSFPESNFDCVKALLDADVKTVKEKKGGFYSDVGDDLITDCGTYAVVIRKLPSNITSSLEASVNAAL